MFCHTNDSVYLKTELQLSPVSLFSLLSSVFTVAFELLHQNMCVIASCWDVSVLKITTHKQWKHRLLSQLGAGSLFLEQEAAFLVSCADW